MDSDPDAVDCPRGNGIPRLGLGTYRNTDHDRCAESVWTALDAGYRHIDTARYYGNERAVGEAVHRGPIPRDEVVVATKLWTDELHPDDAAFAARESCQRLGVETIDLLYVHWPAGDYDPEATLGAFADLRDDGVVDRIGVSNFTPELLDAARDVTAIDAHQFECHPLLPQRTLREYGERHGIESVAYAPIARGAAAENEATAAIADAHDATVVQVALAWLRERGVTAIPKATGADHIRENWASLALDLTDDEVDRIEAIDERRRLIDPDFAPW
jgi:2,5-diketo-D-gluconate reductase B